MDYIRPVVSKDQRVGKIKWNDIEVQNHTVTSRENYGQVSNSEMVLFNKLQDKWRTTGRIADVFKW